MYALAIKNLPEGKDWLYEVKFDGYRCLAGKRNDGVTLWSRRGNLFTAQFPHIARACERLPADTLLDGEIVAVDESVPQLGDTHSTAAYRNLAATAWSTV